MVRILFISDNFPPEVNAPATRTFEHGSEWVKLGAEVTVITCFPNFPRGVIYDGYQNRWRKVEYINGIRVIRVWSFITANEGFLKRTLDYVSFGLMAFLHGLFVKTDVIIATSPQFFAAMAGRALSRWKRKPWIMEVRDLWPESIKTVGAMSDNCIIRHFEKEEKWCYRSAACIVPVTDSFKREIIKKGIPEDKIKVVTNGANFSLFSPRPKDEQLIAEMGLEGKKILGYIGTLGMAHKMDYILECAKKLQTTNPDYHFLLMGDGAEKRDIANKVAKENISNVTIHDAVPKQEVPRYLSILDAAIINLKKTDLFKTVIPSKIFESSAMQIPILLGVDGEARSVVEKYGAGLFYEPENEADFIAKAQYLLAPDTNRQHFIDGCCRLAHAYDRRNLALKMYEIIKAL